jgi:hypothetical protein
MEVGIRHLQGIQFIMTMMSALTLGFVEEWKEILVLRGVVKLFL